MTARGLTLSALPFLPGLFPAADSLEQPKISLAQWSLHQAFHRHELRVEDFPILARQSFGIEAIEYVNSFYVDHSQDESFWHDLKRKADAEGVRSLLIMVDEEGDLGDPIERRRQRAVENHFKWVNAAKILGCHSIRVNAFGDGEKDEVQKALVDGMGALAAYAAGEGIHVLIENHGLYSSDAAWVVEVIRQVDAPNLGTLPDFGNWCMGEEWGSTQDDACTPVYDRYEGVRAFLPYAKGVSAKSYDFDQQGRETRIDYPRMLQLVKESGFDGYIGIEYEGNRLSESEGIQATMKLLQDSW